jgi:hypothetical protein
MGVEGVWRCGMGGGGTVERGFSSDVGLCGPIRAGVDVASDSRTWVVELNGVRWLGRMSSSS